MCCTVHTNWQSKRSMMQLMNLTVSDESNKDMTLIIQLLRDNLNMWTLDLTEREEVIFLFPYLPPLMIDR